MLPLVQVALASVGYGYLSTVAGFLQGTSSCLLATLSLGAAVISHGEGCGRSTGMRLAWGREVGGPGKPGPLSA